MSHTQLLTSECVSMGHPDKVADQISDAILDACIADDPFSRVACETLVTTGQVVIAGEITTKTYVSLPDIARKVINDIGYSDPSLKFDGESCGIMVCIDQQSPDISQGVSEGEGLHKEQGAGDQGMMYGYACAETDELMPFPILNARKILNRLAELRFSGELDYIRPDSKSQLTVEYEGREVKRVHTAVVSTQHSEDAELEQIRKNIIEKVVKEVIDEKYLDKDTIYHINPTGRFVIGGPHGDTGLTGRKIICDTYGGVGSHGGGAFSGKDPSKVDRSATYAARHIAKNIVKAGLASQCEIQLSYAIGIADPLAINVNTFQTEKRPVHEIEKMIWDLFPLTPASIIEYYNLRRPIYLNTARYGHFGIEDDLHPWENTE
ncbi:methionine adenosyltransferase, partial [Planctomycetota bacterium]